MKNFSDTESSPNCLEYQSSNFPLGLINDSQNEIFLEDGDTNEFASTSIFDTYEKVEVSHGFLVSGHNVAETFFHDIEPSERVRVHMDAIEEQGFVKPKAEKVRKGLSRSSSYTKLKAFAKDKLMGIIISMRPWRGHFPVRETMSSVNLTRLTSQLYIGDTFKAC